MIFHFISQQKKNEEGEFPHPLSPPRHNNHCVYSVVGQTAISRSDSTKRTSNEIFDLPKVDVVCLLCLRCNLARFDFFFVTQITTLGIAASGSGTFSHKNILRLAHCDFW